MANEKPERKRDGWFDGALLDIEPLVKKLDASDSQYIRKMVAKRFPVNPDDADRDLSPLDLQRVKDIQKKLESL